MDIMDPILNIPSTLGCWAITLGTYGGPDTGPLMSRRGAPDALRDHGADLGPGHWDRYVTIGYVPRPPNVRPLWYLLDDSCGLLKGSWGVLLVSPHSES